MLTYVLLATLATQAVADVREVLGRAIVDVHVELQGLPYSDPAVLQLIETRVGEPFSMERVRESIDHLVGLGRFEDVRVYVERSPAQPNGVMVRWSLVALQRIARVEVEGNAVFSGDAIRAEIAERAGALPVTGRVPQILESLTTYYADRGYRRARFEPQLMAAKAPELVTLRLRVDAGLRTTIANVSLEGDGSQAAATVINELRVTPGRPYDLPSIEARVAEFEEELRGLRYYEANIDVVPTFRDDGAVADLAVNVERGPRVRVVFAGDPLPQNRRDALVPIRQERSVDLDLLEDASRNIEAYLRQEGYRSAEARYIREEKGEEMVLTFTVSRGPLHRLASIDVEGNASVPQADIAPLIALKVGEPFADGRVSAIAAAMLELYRMRGFARVGVKPAISVVPAPDNAPDGRGVAVRLLVSEGPRTFIGVVRIPESASVPAARITSLLTLTSGRPFYRPQLDADRDAIERLYRNEGFQNVRVEATTSLVDEGRRLDVEWTVSAGARAIVDRVLVNGNVRTSAELIRREVALQPGGPVADDAIVESQRRLATLGLFRRVRIIELPHGASDTRDILIEVEEAPPTAVSYGGGIEAQRRLRSDDGAQAVDRIDIAPRAFFQITRRNLGGRNRSVDFFTRVSFRPRDPSTTPDGIQDEGGYGFNDYRVVSTLREPRLFDRPGDFQLTGFLEQAIRTSFNFRRSGVRIDYGRRFANNINITGRYSIDRTRLFDIKVIDPADEINIDRLFPQVRLSTLTGSVLRDSRNDALDPERGAVIGSDVSVAMRALGSEVGFVKSFSQAFVYRRLPGIRPFTFVAGARAGVALGFQRLLEDGTIVDDVPASERFFAGGDTSVRGFVLDRLGTEDTLTDLGFPKGGSGLVVLNAELRTPYWKGIGGVGFVDAGNVFSHAGDIRIGGLRPAAGAGLRYRSPLGPLRFDVGVNLDRRLLPTGGRERGVVFHLSLGQAF